MRRYWRHLFAMAMFFTAGTTAPVPAAAGDCRFVLGFEMLHNLIPGIVGDCLVDEHYNPENGDALQETSNGLLVWRKADNFTAFTDGYRTWVNGPFGIQQRLNTQRFFWESDAAWYEVIGRSAPSRPVGLRIPRVGIAAEIVWLGLDPSGGMQSPDGPDPVAWYTFSALPGMPGNAVFAGHVDWRTGVTAVFWRLRELAPGDQIFVDGENGQTFHYAVSSVTVYPDDDSLTMQIAGPRPDDVITLITCEGVFNRATRNYDQRLVVVAKRTG